MQRPVVTTPVGRRPMTLALVRHQLASSDIAEGKVVEKWKVFRDICEARVLLGVQDRALAVLDALLTFHPHSELSEETGLIVFPSNAQLSVRAHGITGTTLRRHLGALVDAGLILRRDSPNGKRYARKDRSGDIEHAFGFSLAPLLARAEELAALAQQVAAEQRHFRITKEALTICRRDVRKLIAAAVAEDALGDWKALEQRLEAILAGLSRNPALDEVEAALGDMEALRADIVNQLEKLEKTEKKDANDNEFGCHIQNSNTKPSNEFEPALEQEQGGRVAPDQPATLAAIRPAPETKAFPLPLVLRACPRISDYGPGGTIAGWRDLMSAAVVVRSMLGVSPSAYQEACEVLGPESAAVAMACILERTEHISSAGGYLRNLTARARQGEFSLGPMLMAQLRANGNAVRRA